MSLANSTILKLFRDADSGFVSGEMISRELKVSRTAVWKHIKGLRGAGYLIEAIPSRGYRLLSTPDILDETELRDRLQPGLIGLRLVCLPETSSTNTVAFQLADEGAVEGTVVTADAQSGGKGRMGRVWSSPPGINLYCSVVLRPKVRPYQAPQLTFLSAVAVAKAIEATTGLKPEIKWPNDVLLGGRKVAGLLNEMSAETDAINFVILGIGVNLNMATAQFPADLRAPATSLLIEQGRPVNRVQFTAQMLHELDKLYAGFLECGFAPVREEWQKRCNANDREVIVTDGGKDELRGMFNGIDGEGALLVRMADGSVERVVSGDVRVI
jgi:BirA family biotin operon repressor/biotin-[acetyl-CoA-carboxylase] ligase